MRNPERGGPRSGFLISTRGWVRYSRPDAPSTTMNTTAPLSIPTPDARLLEALVRHESLLLAGRDVPAEELCADQPDLIEPLRAALQQLRTFRQRFEGEAPAVASPPGYAIERELGRGGMGV